MRKNGPLKVPGDDIEDLCINCEENKVTRVDSDLCDKCIEDKDVEFKKPGPVTVRPLNDEEKDYFRKRKMQLEREKGYKADKYKKSGKKTWGWPNPYGEGGSLNGKEESYSSKEV